MSEENTIREVDDAGNVIPSSAPQKTQTTPQSSFKQNLGIPIAIVIAAAIVAGAIIFNGNRGNAPVNVQGGIDTAQNTEQTPETEVAPVTETDFIRGNPNAPVVIVEYSDFDCPFCKSFHGTMNQIMDKYGADGKVAWIYRNYPLEQLHPNAPKIAAASYCVAEQGGDQAFWKFSDFVFGGREMNESTDLAKLSDYAVNAGVDKAKFELCQNSGKYDSKVAEDVVAAQKAGARGTPYSVVMIGDQQGVINGAQPYTVVEQIVDNLLSQLEGKAVPQ